MQWGFVTNVASGTVNYDVFESSSAKLYSYPITFSKTVLAIVNNAVDTEGPSLQEQIILASLSNNDFYVYAACNKDNTWITGYYIAIGI